MAGAAFNGLLSGRRIVITGAGRGLGRALAITAADCGADLVLLGRDQAMLNAVGDTIQSRSAREALVVCCDLSRPESIASACETVLAVDQRVDVLVNNASPWLSGNLEELAVEEITATVSAAVSGTILVTKGLLPGLQRSVAADVVTVVSTSGWIGWDLRGASVAFNAAKHGQSGFSDRLRYELRGRGIRVSALYPPDFEDKDPLETDWAVNTDGESGRNITNREIVSTILFVLTAPRTCAFPVIIIDGMRQ